MLRTGLEKLASLEGEKHYVLCDRMGGEDITYNTEDNTFDYKGKHLTQEEVDKDISDYWYIYEIKNINGIDIREPVKGE